jgi:uncharacterized ion transporter superfamily protein YfcC
MSQNIETNKGEKEDSKKIKHKKEKRAIESETQKKRRQWKKKEKTNKKDNKIGGIKNTIMLYELLVHSLISCMNCYSWFSLIL